MSIMLIFLGDITCNPLEYRTPKHAPPPDWIPPHGPHRPAAGLDRSRPRFRPCPVPTTAVPIHRLARPMLTPTPDRGQSDGLKTELD